jgi:hypothetical protein
MWRHQWAVLAAILALSIGPAPAGAQGGGMGMGMGMRHDSTTRARMAVIHDLMLNHDRISRTVTNLTDGVRTVTESDDAVLAQRIKEHVGDMHRQVVAGDDPGWPMESEALRTIFRDHARIRTVIDTTAKGIVMMQTSADSGTVAALQRHAAEVSELVRGGMAAMHARMRHRGGRG